jgi:hypothetical protein
MEHEGSLPCSQEPATWSYAELNKTILRTLIALRCNLILTSCLQLFHVISLLHISQPDLSMKYISHIHVPTFITLFGTFDCTETFL